VRLAIPIALQAFNKALFIFPDSIPATVHLSQAYLTLAKEGTSEMDNVDLVAGMLSDLTQGPGWDVPEAWYFLRLHVHSDCQRRVSHSRPIQAAETTMSHLLEFYS
jgi:hypothetical protein